MKRDSTLIQEQLSLKHQTPAAEIYILCHEKDYQGS